MTLASEVFGPEHGQVTLHMEWMGRGETPAEIASRLLPTMKILTGLHAGGRAGFYSLGGSSPDARVRLPDSLEDLTAYAAEKSDREPDGSVREQGRTSLVALLLADPSRPALQADAMLSVVAGTPLELSNYVSADFSAGFPLGSPRTATRWFADVVRTWQPEYAVLRTDLSNNPEDDRDTYAGYLAWVSAGTYGIGPEVPSAVQMPFGEGTLYVAKDWSIKGFRAFSDDLVKVGAVPLLSVPKVQNPPKFGEGHPEALASLDETVRWGAD